MKIKILQELIQRIEAEQSINKIFIIRKENELHQVLVLQTVHYSTFNVSNEVRLMTLAGVETDITSKFTFGSRVEIYKVDLSTDILSHHFFQSCSLTWKNLHYVFGGDKQPRQISRVTACGLTRVKV